MKIIHINRYINAQKAHHCYQYTIISLSISGLISHSRIFPPMDPAKPLFHLLPANTEIDFEYNHKRENWVVVLDIELFSDKQNPVNVIYKSDGKDIVLPGVLQVAPEHVSGWEGEFVRMKDAFNAGTPTDILRCEVGVYNILRYFLDCRPDMYYATAAAHLRWLIDNDTEVDSSLEELSIKCGYSPDHLRVLFEKQYNQTPLEYRNRKRMTKAMDLIGNSSLRIKEIAMHLGFHHVSHFSAMFKNHYNFTPTHAIQRFRKF